MKRTLIILTPLLLLAAIALGWLGYSDAGLRWAYARLAASLPGELQVGSLEGRLVGPITLHEVAYTYDATRIDAKRLMLRWRPAGLLLQGELDLDAVEVDGLSVDTEPEDITEVMEEVFLTLPVLELPFTVHVDRFEVNGLAFSRSTTVQRFDRFDFSGELRSHRISVESARLLAPWGELSFRGRLRPEVAYAHELDLEWRLELPTQAELRGSGTLRGNLKQTLLQQKVEGAARFELDLEIDDLEKRPAWRGRLVLADFDTARLAQGLTPLSGSADITASGNLRSASASGEMRLQTPLPQPLQASFELDRITADADYRELVVERLRLRSGSGELQADGRVDWRQTVNWDLQLVLENFDPAQLAPQWPGRIAARVESRGELLADGPVARFRIDGLRGTLRDYPVALDGGLRWRDSVIELEQIDFTSGTSRLAVTGSIDQQLNLSWTLDSPDLRQLYPEAAGRLEARGDLFGPRAAPGVTAEFSGDRIELANLAAERVAGRLTLARMGSLQVEQLARNLELSLDADAVSLDQTRFDQVEIDAGDGRITLRANSAQSRLQLGLAGAATDSGWSGSLVSAHVAHPEFGDWSLTRPAPLELLPGNIRLQDACAAESVQGRLCVSAEGSAGDWSFDGELRAVPLSRLQPWLPPDLQFTGDADADARLQLADGSRLLGKLQFRLAPGVMRYRLQAEQSEAVDYRGGTVDVDLGAAGIEARADIGLRPDETLGVELTLPDANLLSLNPKSQQLRARTQLVLADIGIVESLLADVTDLRGGLEIEARLSGRLDRPRVRGTAKLVDAGFILPRLRLRVDQLRGEARSDGLETTDYSFVARIAGGSAELEGSTRLDADAGWPSQLRFRGAGFSLASLLRTRLPPGMKVEGDFGVEASLALALPERLTGDIVMRVKGGSLAYPLVEDEIERWALSDTEVNVVLDSDGLRASTDLAIGDNRMRGSVTLPGARILALDPATQALRGGADFEFGDLSLLATLLPEILRPRGVLDGRVDLAGTVAAPGYDLNARLRDASVQVPRLGLEINRIVADARTDESGQLQFTARGESGDGYLEIVGSSHLDTASGVPTELRISGQNFSASNIPEAIVTASPDLLVKIGDYRIDIGGEVLIPYARLQPRDLSTAARVSADTDVIGAEQQPARRWQITSSVRLVLGDRVSFFGYGFEGRLGGYLTVNEQPGQPTSGTGVIDIIEGRYRAYGQHLDIQDGRLLFAGGPLTNPGIDVRAVRQTGDVTAGVSVSGLLRQPRVELFSEPAMGQTDILSYLLTGGPLETANSEQGAMMANAAIALGLSGGDRIARSLASRFGFEDLRVESSSTGEQASLIMGRYLSSRLYVSYGIGLIESINTLNLRYQISRRWRIEAESGQEHGADLLYTIER